MAQNSPAPNNDNQAWKSRMYLMGTVIGAAMGFLSAYMFAREAEQNSENGEMPDIPPSTLLALALSVLGLMRQISDTGKKSGKKDNSRNRRGRR